MKDKLELLKEKQSQISNLKNDVIELSSGIFEDFYKYIFEKYHTLESFGWTQYTPYFNDGDATIFNANTDYLIINDEYAEDSDWFSQVKILNWGQWNYELKTYEGRIEEPNKDYNENLVNAYNEIVDFLSHFDNDFYLSKFGDHAEITVNKDGFDISDYDHD